MCRGLVIITGGLIIGIGIGLGIGWLFPLYPPQTTPVALAPMWQADYILMTAQAYSLDGDLTTARQRLSDLGYANAGPIVAQRGLQAIAENAPPEDVGRLARLAAALGVRLPELDPYLSR